MADCVEVPALGRTAHIGWFYDMSTHQVLPENVFKFAIPPEAIQSSSFKTLEQKYNHGNSYSSRFAALDINGGLSLSILAGQIPIPLIGSASYINKEKSNETLDRFSAIWKTRTREETLNLNFEGLKDFVAERSLIGKTGQSATHIIVGISYGADVIIDWEYSKSEIDNPVNILGFNINGEIGLNKGLEKLLDHIGSLLKKEKDTQDTEQEKKTSDGLNVVKQKSSVITNQNLKFTIFSDSIVETPSSTEEFLRDLNKINTKLENEKGVPKVFILKPINGFAESLQINLEFSGTNLVKADFEMDVDDCKKIHKMFDEITKSKTKVEKYYKELTEEDFPPKLKAIKEDEEKIISIERFRDEIKYYKKNDTDKKQLEKVSEEIIKGDKKIIDKWDLYLQIKILQDEIKEMNKLIKVIIAKVDAGDQECNIKGERLTIGRIKPYFGYFEYKGELKDGKKNGKGTIYWSNGYRYEGEWKDGNRNGKGTYYWPNGIRYAGEWNNDKMNGSGTYYWSDGHRYEGEWKDDKRNGTGTLFLPNGDRYEGEWKDDKKNGKGAFFWSNSGRYEGEWKDDQIKGTGTYFWLDGDRYDGEWI